MKRKIRIIIIAIVLIAGIGIYFWSNRAHDIVVTGVVTTDSVMVSSEIQGRLQQLLVKEGDTVTNGQLLAVIQPQEWSADMSFYANSERQSQAQVMQAEADLRYQEAQTSNQISEAEANLASAQAQEQQADADLENAKLTYNRIQDLFNRGVESAQAADQARTTFDGAKAHVDALGKQVEAAQAALALAQASADQTAASRAALEASKHQLAASGAQKEKAQVHLGYTEVRAPINGTVDVRAALQGEVVNPGQAIVTLVNPDDLWVRADVEESYIDRIRIGDRMKVKLPSGAVREGTVFFRNVDADYATQRDVSRTKRDIKTFEVRLRCDNKDRALAVGMSAYVTMPLGKP
jgi:HlyD family secretion protein